MEASELNEVIAANQALNSTLLGLAGGIIVSLAGVIAFLFHTLEKKNTIIIDLGKAFVETTLGVKTTLDNTNKMFESTNKVIEKLPETITMYLKINGK